MACMNALCDRLKRLFEKKRPRIEEAATATVHVNPLTPIQEVDLLNLSSEKSDRRPKRSKLERVLRFSSSSLSDKETLVSLSLTISIEPQQNLASIASPSRYKNEFHELELIGSGEFGSVYRCLNRLDGCVYAIKRSKILRSGYAQRRATNEVHANAVLNNCRHVVRYFSAWLEDERMSIQQEYCNAGDLALEIQRRSNVGEFFEESELCRLLLHVARGLKYIHGTNLAHMDIKPENIFISRERIWTHEKDDENSVEEEIVYKIGDLGHATSVLDIQELEDEGDCRYLSKEVLSEDYTDLTKADVFALGLTIYETAGGGPLPKNGPTWQIIREGKLKKLERYSDELIRLVKMMIHVNPKKRPSAKEILQRIEKNSVTGELMLTETTQ